MSQAAIWAVVALCGAGPAARLVWVQHRRRLRGLATLGPTLGQLHVHDLQFEVIHHGRCRPDVVQRYLAARPPHQAVFLVVEESAEIRRRSQ